MLTKESIIPASNIILRHSLTVRFQSLPLSNHYLQFFNWWLPPLWVINFKLHTLCWVSLYYIMSQDAYVTMLFSDGYLQGENSFLMKSIECVNGYFQEPKSWRHRYEMVAQPKSWRSLSPPIKLIDFFRRQSPNSRYECRVSNRLINLGIIWLCLTNANTCVFKYVQSAAFRATWSYLDIDKNQFVATSSVSEMCICWCWRSRIESAWWIVFFGCRFCGITSFSMLC